MQKLFFLTIFSLLSASAFAQQFTKKEDSDPKAKAVLEAMRQQVEGYNSLQADFTLKIEYPEQPVSTETGTLLQQGDKYRLNLSGRTIVSDGESVWLYLEKNKEVQINNAEEDGEGGTINSPKDLFRAYEWDNYIYVLVNEFSENGRVIQQIEFKPLDRDSDFSKIRLTVDKKTLQIVRIKSFSKDGSRFTLIVDKLKPNAAVTDSTFIFTKKECPDCHFEDLRI
ncbi:MAG TPA: outer membrane lipoprotein carrier protein LolA [Bacteroidetes bacterium]|nr:outer membrane lipoprotein carrier protein LolA [Bacteroidota bacterium]